MTSAAPWPSVLMIQVLGLLPWGWKPRGVNEPGNKHFPILLSAVYVMLVVGQHPPGIVGGQSCDTVVDFLTVGRLVHDKVIKRVV